MSPRGDRDTVRAAPERRHKRAKADEVTVSAPIPTAAIWMLKRPNGAANQRASALATAEQYRTPLDGGHMSSLAAVGAVGSPAVPHQHPVDMLDRLSSTATAWIGDRDGLLGRSPNSR
jgi:hypothetical protein